MRLALRVGAGLRAHRASRTGGSPGARWPRSVNVMLDCPRGARPCT